MAADLAGELIRLVKKKFGGSPLSGEFLRRIRERKLTRDENPVTHFGVYFAGFDPAVREVFVGRHKKSDLWLFNGGHIDLGESLVQTLEREMEEEWGFVHPAAKTLEPCLLTITEITNDRQICRRHYDIWYFAPVDKTTFSPDEAKLAKEFHQIKWATFAEARKAITDLNTLTAVDVLEKSGRKFKNLY